LIAPNVVVSAAHCPILARCSERIFIGEDVSKPEQGRIVNVKETTIHPGYSEHDPFDDLTVLVLEENVDGVAPRRVASPETLADVATVRLVGFGNTDTYGSTGYGIRRLVDVGLASQDPKYGANPKSEFVAGAPFLDRDSCSGDSGGPAYVDVTGEWQLAGATSRSTKTALRKCGDGGVYTWVSVYRDWITSVGGRLP
jgi:secreted trypsin-like serine protease